MVKYWGDRQHCGARWGPLRAFDIAPIRGPRPETQLIRPMPDRGVSDVYLRHSAIRKDGKTHVYWRR